MFNPFRKLIAKNKWFVSRQLQALERAEQEGGRDGEAMLDALTLLERLEQQKTELETREQQKIAHKISERISDVIATLSGTITFALLHVVWFALWIWVNTGHPLFGIAPFDRYPFGFLTLVVSLEAIFLATFILISQNRQASVDRFRDEIDFERDRLDLKVDTIAAKIVKEITLKLDRI